MDALLEIALRAALAGGEQVMRVYADPFEVIQKEDRTPVTEADLASERAIVAILREAVPDIPIVSEETVPAEGFASPAARFWCVDPLDGTKEFIARNDEFSFHAEDDLLKLLVRITVHKSLRQVAHHRAAKRNPEQEIMQASDGDDFLALVAADEPGPEVEVALLDELEKFMGRLPEFDRDVLSLKVQGFSTVEIAKKLGSYDRKVRRALERIQATAEGHLKPTAD